MGSNERRRKERIARNEALFREVNERVLDIVGEDDPDTIDFLCECGDPDCTGAVPLSSSEYEHVRADPLLFAVLPGHEIEAVESVVERNERYFVVRKHASESSVAHETDPRS